MAEIGGLLTQGIASSLTQEAKAVDYGSLEAAELELSRQLDRLDELIIDLSVKMSRILSSGSDTIAASSGPHDMNSSIGCFVMNAADRIRVAGNRIEELAGRVDL